MQKTLKLTKEKMIGYHNNGNITKFYDFSQRIGKGGQALVYLCKHKTTRQPRVVKIYSKDRHWTESKVKQIKKEMDALLKLDHPNVVKIYEIFENTEKIFLVQEYIKGRTIYQVLCKQNGLNENDVRTIMEQIILALINIHKNNIVHRDLNYDNILIIENDDTFIVKIIDFGLCHKVDSKIKMNKIVGHIHFFAPEMIEAGAKEGNNPSISYGKEVDMWAVGVLLYMMVTGFAPFDGKNADTIMIKIMNRACSMSSSYFDGYSESVLFMLENLLTVKKVRRLTAEGAYEHEWFKWKREELESNPIDLYVLKKLWSFSQFQKFKKIILYMMAIQIDGADTDEDKADCILEFKEAFQKIDKNNDGVITKQEFIRTIVAEFEKDEDLKNEFIENKDIRETLEEMVKGLDMDLNNMISYSEFLSSIHSNNNFQEEQCYLKLVFDQLDSNGDGLITKKELNNYFSKGVADLQYIGIAEMIDEVDFNGDGKIDFKELSDYIRTGTKRKLLDTLKP